ncbi:MAG TPA: hypothetical protein VHC18_14230 [Amycolatopsis sp.]|jgi:hypothetical protein|nr:hypothetical protein [Amycolatopsis sp.]
MPDPTTVGSWSTSVIPVTAGMVLIAATFVLALSLLGSFVTAALYAGELTGVPE